MVPTFNNWTPEPKPLVSNLSTVTFKIMALAKKESGSLINHFSCTDNGKWKNFQTFIIPQRSYYPLFLS